MISLIQKLAGTVCILFLLPFSTPAQASEVTQIRIVSAWGGLGTPRHNELTITRKNADYYADGKKVDARLVANLLNALNARVIPSVRLANLGITQAWLDANAEQAVKGYREFYSTTAPNLQSLYLSTFKDMGLMKHLVPSLYGTRWTDDVPFVEVEVTRRDGSKLVTTSDAQQLFMLPWVVMKGRRKVKTYNTDIARAVVALMPNEFVNRERLSGEDLSSVLAEAVMWEIEEKWEFLDAENKAGKYLRALKHTFSVDSAEINSYHSVDFGKEWVTGDPGFANLQAILKRKDLPRNLKIGIALPFTNGEVEGVDTFLGSVDRYLNLTLSVPWLKQFMRSHPTAQFELRFVGDRSFSEKAMYIFAADMRLKDKESLVKEVEAVQNDVSLLAVRWKYQRDYWLVLPDKRIVLWRFYESPVKWRSLIHSGWECSNYHYQDKCIGAVISRHGSVVDK